MKMNKQIAQLALDRAKNYCEKCGGVGRDDLALHHRKLKSRGGKDEVANLMVVHHKCHNMGTDSIHANPDVATRNGWMVPSWSDPAIYPITLPDGLIVRFDNLGSWTRITDTDGIGEEEWHV